MAIYGWPVVKRLSGIETVPVSGELADFVIATDGTLHAVDGGVPSQVSTAAATVLADDAVTYAKIQNVTATDKILGRSTAGAGDVEEITCTAAGRALIDDVDAAAQRTTLGLGTLATLSTITSTDITDLTVATADIANDAVTYAKIQNVSATDKLLGRSTAGAGDVEEIACTSFARSILDDTTAAAVVATINAYPGATVIAGATDLNTVITIGYYQSDAAAASVNGPNGVFGYTLEVDATSGRVHQEFTSISGGSPAAVERYTRGSHDTGTTWSTWDRMITLRSTPLADYANDGMAAAGGIPINGLYRTGSDVKMRVS